jgi:hypothetical protein
LESRDSRKRWWLALLSAVIVTLIAVGPQLHFSLSRGAKWNGAYAQTHGDEAVYAAYLAALIDGRPRRNNPYSGRDDSPAHPVAESVFSVQFIPPLLIAKTAQLLHFSTAKAFIVLTGVTAFGSALAVFWLLAVMIKDPRVAAVGVLVVLFATSSSLILEYLLGVGDSNNYLPFLRRYLPSFPFPILCVYCGLTWQMLAADSKRLALKYALGAGLLFGVLTFSYVYHWSFAVVWTFCLAGIWFVARPPERKNTLQRIAVLVVCMIAVLIPCLLLMSRLGATTGEVHFMAASHIPDFFRLIEILGLAIMVIITLLVRRRKVKVAEPVVIFILASALTPFVLFNQQVVTGRSLQPFHYEVFIGSYTTVLAAFVTIVLCWRSLAFLRPATRPMSRPAIVRLLLLGVAGAAILSGSAQATLLSRRQYQGNLFRDEARPALLRLAEIGRETKDGALDTRSIVYAPNFVVTGALASTAPQPVLWAQHLFVFPDVTLAEDKQRLAQFLYYQGVVFTDIDRYHWQLLDSDRKYYLISLIGRGRFNPRLSVDWKPIAPEEVQGALDYYANFVVTFDRARAANPQISYLLVGAEDLARLSNFDRWYERDQGEQVGSYVLYRVRLR